MFVLEIGRLLLRELEPQDADGLGEVLSDAASMRYYPHPFTAAQVDEWIGPPELPRREW